MSDWISVEDRMPTEDDMQYEDGWYHILFWDGKTYQTDGWGTPNNTCHGLLEEHATHWMALPNAPVVTQQENSSES